MNRIRAFAVLVGTNYEFVKVLRTCYDLNWPVEMKYFIVTKNTFRNPETEIPTLDIACPVRENYTISM